MASFNKVILIGNLVENPDLKQTPNGIPVTSFRIAIQRKGDKNKQEVDFINVIAWRQTAEFVKRFFQKGNSILVCGALQSRNWTDANNQKRYSIEVVADEINFVEKKQNNPDKANNDSDFSDYFSKDEDNELPF